MRLGADNRPFPPLDPPLYSVSKINV